MGSGAVRWSCARCEVSVGRIDGSRSRLPETWTESQGLTYCLACSRARAAEEAIDAVPESTSREDRVKLQRRAVIAFELDRTPAAPDRVIANACRTSSRAVATVRDELADGDLAEAAPAADHAARSAA
jgi:hypothetical protein